MFYKGSRNLNSTSGTQFSNTSYIFILIRNHSVIYMSGYVLHHFIACGPVPTVPNSVALPGTHTLGSVRQYDCSPGFVPDAPPQIECLVNAQWSPVAFACVGR